VWILRLVLGVETWCRGGWGSKWDYGRSASSDVGTVHHFLGPAFVLDKTNMEKNAINSPRISRKAAI
jgi:hypothetical protein